MENIYAISLKPTGTAGKVSKHWLRILIVITCKTILLHFLRHGGVASCNICFANPTV